jgi:hypothetical protein
MRSYKNQRNLLVDSFDFFIRGSNNQVQLKGTKYYFRVQDWNFAEIRKETSPDSGGIWYIDIPRTVEYVLDHCDSELQTELLFHLDLFMDITYDSEKK